MAWQVFVMEPPAGRELCDFCSASPTTRLFACRNFVIPRTKYAVFQQESVGAWAACDPCGLLIDAGHWSQLTDRALRRFMRIHGLSQSEEPEVRTQLAEIHQLFREHMIKEV